METKVGDGALAELHQPSSLTEKWLTETFGEEVSSFELDKEAVAPPGAGGTLSTLSGITVHTKSGRKIKVVAKFTCADENVKAFVDMAGLQTREAAFYKYALPALNKLAERHKVDLPLVPCYLALTSPLILEDLRPQGYRTPHPTKGLSEAEAQCAMEALARFHATSMMIEEVLEDGNDDIKLAGMQEHLSGQLTEGVNIAQEKLSDNKGIVQYLDMILSKKAEFVRFTADEPFTSIIHTDLWVYNLLFRDSDDGSAEDCILLDWQFWNPIGSAGFDIATILLSGLDPEDYKKNVNSLLKCYHDQLIVTLKKLECNETLLQKRSFSALQEAYRGQIEHTTVALLCAADTLFQKPELTERLLHAVKEAYSIHVEKHGV